MAEYIERSVGASVLRAKANMAVLMDAAPYFEKAAQILEKLPAADVVPVVRCKDCIHYREYMGRDMCAKNATMLDGREVGLRATGKDEFCSYGAKMDGGGADD